MNSEVMGNLGLLIFIFVTICAISYMFYDLKKQQKEKKVSFLKTQSYTLLTALNFTDAC